MGSKGGMIMPIVSKVYCSTSEVDFVVRRRPNVANGGGFAVVDSDQRVVFKVDGCGVVGKKEELIPRGGEGNALLLMRRKIGVMKELEQVMRNRDLYHVRTKPGIDKVFVFGVIAVLDYIYD
ncbi:hypothetical protein BUALT_Bualt09G0042800 [Buddleja alternifolia]|uniref:Uncharacterized protein n=1 Tax=Buddleja alternifolia TaxID=168488 RepID=A0AAV6X141_9LAMI|nr:hypothetical protein BUALT_Bualt09G0042800 [Buddleja alternifolia]